MEEKEKFLPIGTVVLLKGGKREIMITSYCIIPTGEVYNKGMAVADNSLTGIGIGSSEANMGKTTIKWNNKKYEIGVLEEYSAKWDGKKKLSGDGDNAVYGDTSRSTALFTIKVPKDYDGVMVAILKRGTNEKSYAKYKARYDKYQELLKDYYHYYFVYIFLNLYFRKIYFELEHDLHKEKCNQQFQ